MEKLNDINVQCCRCRHQHLKSQRTMTYRTDDTCGLVCPRCNGSTYFDMTPQVAWCWASGQIEFGDVGTVPDGAIVVASGAKAHLRVVIEATARHGKGASAGKLLVPGIPEAEDQQEAGDALEKWTEWLRKRKHQYVQFGSEVTA